MSIGKKFCVNFTNMALVLVLGTAMFSAGCGDDKTVNYYTGGTSTSGNNNSGNNSGDNSGNNSGDKDPNNSNDKDPNNNGGDNNNPGGDVSEDGKYVRIVVAADSLPANVTNIQYIYSDSEGNQVGKSNSETIDRSSSTTTVEDKDAPGTAVKVIIIYLDKDGNFVATDEKDIDWSNDGNGNTTGTVESSDPNELDKNAKLVLKADKYAVKPAEQVKLTCLLLSGDGSSLDVTNLAAFSNVYGDVLKNAGGEAGVYQAVGYNGKHGGIADKISVTASTASGEQTVQIDKPIYVTDQSVADIKLAPADIDGKTVTVNDNNTPHDPTDDYSIIVYVPDEVKGETVHQTFNQKVGTFSRHGLYEEVDAINEQPMVALASYTSDPEKGPSPSGVDVTEQTVFSAEDVTVLVKDLPFAPTMQGNVVCPTLDFSSMKYNTDMGQRYKIKVTGKYINGDEEISAFTNVQTVAGWAHTSFAFKNDDGTFKPVSYELNDCVYGERKVGEAINCGVKSDPSSFISQKFYMKGVICRTGKYFLCDIPEELLPADGYPGATSGGAGISTVSSSIKQTVSGYNEYLLEVNWAGYKDYDHIYFKISPDSTYKAAKLPSFAAGEAFRVYSHYGSYSEPGLITLK